MSRTFLLAVCHVALLCLGSCADQDELTARDVEKIRSLLISSDWKVDMFFNGEIITEDFASYVLHFSDGGEVTTGTGSIGAWQLNESYRSGPELRISMGGNPTVALLENIWEVVEYREDFLLFREKGRGEGEIKSVNRLAIRKI